MSAPRIGAAPSAPLLPRPPAARVPGPDAPDAWPLTRLARACLRLVGLGLACALVCGPGLANAQERPAWVLLALGEGLESSGERRWTDELTDMLARSGQPAELIDLRRAETSVRTVREDVDLHVLTRDPDVVLVQLGGYDGRPRFDDPQFGPVVSPHEFDRHLRDVIDELVRREVQVVLLTPTPRVFSGSGDAPAELTDASGWVLSTGDLAEGVRRLARNTGVELLDHYGLRARHTRAKEPVATSDDALATAPVRVDDAHRVELAQRLTAKLLDRVPTVARRPSNPVRDRARWVEAGRLNADRGRAAGPAWSPREGFLEGHADGSRLHFDLCAEPGDFDLRLRCVPAGGAGAGLSIGCAGASLTFERAGAGRLKVTPSGALWRGIGPAEFAVPTVDAPIEVQLRRRHRRELELWVAGERVLRHFFTGRLEPWTLAGNDQVRLYSATLEGTLSERAAPLSNERVLPQLDLAGEVERQTVVERIPGQYLGHVSTLTLDDGGILATYPEGHGRGAIVMKRSDDGGLTWSERLELPENFATSREVPTLWRVVDARGTRRIALFSGLYPIRLSISEDDGQSFSPLEPVGDWGGIVAMGDVIPLKQSGHYLALFHDDGRFRYGGGGRGQFFVLASKSTDGGLTWGEPRTIASLPHVDLCEPGFARSPDGEELAVCLRENSRTRNSFLITSRDEGRTWSEPVELPADLTGDRHTLRYAPDGRLVITFRDTGLLSDTAGDWLLWVGTYDDLVNGRPGQYRARLMDNRHRWDCAYPGLELRPDGTFVATTYGHWTEGESPYIVSVRFNLSELDERVAALEASEEPAR